MISDFEFEDGPKVFRAALPVARRIGRLAQRARAANPRCLRQRQSWQVAFGFLGDRAPLLAGVVERGANCADCRSTVPRLLCSQAQTLRIQCVLFTATDAYVRDFQLAIPRDCVAARTASEDRLARRFLRNVLGADMRPSTRLRLNVGGGRLNG